MLAFRRIVAARDGGSKSVACPVCDREGLEVVDCSARPYAEWYKLTCKSCGLDDMLAVPLGRPSSAN
jgi:hypothetical protein